MRNRTCGVDFFMLLVFMGLFLLSYTAYAAYTGKYKPGMTLPKLTFHGLTSPEDQAYLGVKGDTFTLGDVSARLVIIDVMSVL